ncbi:toxin-antitoxin system YwqK family antitoxin [Salinimonas sediminis]|uniref:Toxin-antitoxin system YwqK family antitoxin n=1 Tax=Salinimonas sediminis TaxID=2303538 RepID=A0A346NIQ3_9ALTE|nr:hypothetical protein [Salinimonas sediminis]AXR05410.1 hypothetical protein D0Y50_02925 [Salinimonas sediminis]
MRALVLFLALFVSGYAPLSYAGKAYLDVNLRPTTVEVNRTYYYSTDIKPDANGVYTIAVYDQRDKLIVTLQSTTLTIGRGTLTGTQLAAYRQLGLLSRIVYAFGEGYTGQMVMRSPQGYLLERVPYVDGKQQGAHVEFYENGALQAFTPYAANKKVSTARRWSRAGQLVQETKRTAQGEFISQSEWTVEGRLRQQTVPVAIPGYAPGLKETTWQNDRTVTFIAAAISDPDNGFVPNARHPYKLVKKVRDGHVFELVEENGYGNNGEQRLMYEDWSIVKHMKDGKQDGLYREQSGGKVTNQGHYRNGVKVGDWQETNGDDRVIYATYTQRGQLNGPRKVYDASSNTLLIEEVYLNGKLHGKYEEHAATGELIARGHYQQARKEGAWIEPERDNRWQGHYDMGKKTGAWTRVNGRGYTTANLHYAAGKLQGKQYLFADNGALTLFEHYQHGKRHGQRVTYENGVVQTVQQFKQGQLQ